MSRLEEHTDTKSFGRERSFSASVHGSSQGLFENKTFLFHLWSMVFVCGSEVSSLVEGGHVFAN